MRMKPLALNGYNCCEPPVLVEFGGRALVSSSLCGMLALTRDRERKTTGEPLR